MEIATVDDAIAYAYYPQKGRRSWGGTARRGLRSVARGMGCTSKGGNYVIR